MDESQLYQEQRPRLVGLAYRMLGSVAEAEDVVQEAFIRLHRAVGEGAELASPPAFLATVVTRLCIDQLRSARARREQYVGPWLPEPLVAQPGPEAAAQIELADSLSIAFLLLLEQLSPVERAVFLLREVFDYGYDEIARVVERSEANCRQLVARARKHLRERRPRFEASAERREELARRFFAACEEGDTAALLRMLAEDAALYGDGGGKAPAFPRVLAGRETVASVMANLFAQGRRIGATAAPVVVNGQPGLLARDPAGRIINVFALDVVDGRIQAVRSIVNPDKLGHLGPVADVAALLRQRDRSGEH